IGTYITEYAIPIQGYNANTPSIGKYLTATGNEFTFYYTPVCPPGQTAVYLVHYYYLDGSGCTTRVAVDKFMVGTVGSLITEYAVSVPGYTLLSQTSITKTLAPAGTDFVFYYTRC
ncbi:MAG: hypothetical protein LBQ98_07600, partial [Nitrososphaerota archaeon]|nr:hypothetical protein [Nitrososphaerota archaeon]